MTSSPPRKPTRQRNRNPLTLEDRQLWKRVADTTTPLSIHCGSILKEEMAKLLEAAAPADESTTPRPAAFDFKPDSGIQNTQPKPALHQMHPIEERIARNLGRGKHAIDARIDLHGMTQDRARFALLDFLQMAQRANHRMVLVITGKGDQGRGVLKSNVPRWLSLPGFSQLVNGYRESHGAHGGEGALYVRIRKPRGSPGR